MEKKKLGQSSHHGCFLQAFFSGDIASFSKPLLFIIFEETWKDRWVLLQEHWQGKCIGGAMYPKAETQSLTWEVGWAFWRTSSWGIQEGNKQRQAYSPDPGRQKARHNFLGFVIFFIPSPLSGDFLTWATGCTWDDCPALCPYFYLPISQGLEDGSRGSLSPNDKSYSCMSRVERTKLPHTPGCIDLSIRHREHTA